MSKSILVLNGLSLSHYHGQFPHSGYGVLDRYNSTMITFSVINDLAFIHVRLKFENPKKVY